MRKIMCFCDRCAAPANYLLQPSKRNMRFFDLAISCHGETEKFLVAMSELVHKRDKTGKETAKPLYVIAFEGPETNVRTRVIETVSPYLTTRVWNHTNRLTGEY